MWFGSQCWIIQVCFWTWVAIVCFSMFLDIGSYSLFSCWNISLVCHLYNVIDCVYCNMWHFGHDEHAFYFLLSVFSIQPEGETLNAYHKAMFLWSFQRGLEGFRFDLGDQHLMADHSSPTMLVQRSDLQIMWIITWSCDSNNYRNIKFGNRYY